MRGLGIFFLTVALAACVTKHKKMTREEWLQVGQHSYVGIKKEVLIDKAQKVLELADGDDFHFSYTPNGFVASRNWFLYYVIGSTQGTDYWTFNVEEKDGKLVADVRASTTAGTLTAYSNGMGASTVTTPTIGIPIEGTALFNLYWRSLDYVLGLTDRWEDCRDGLERVKRDETWGYLVNICDSVTLNNSYPDNLSDSEIERIFKDRYYDKWAYMKKYHRDRWEEQKKKDLMLPHLSPFFALP